MFRLKSHVVSKAILCGTLLFLMLPNSHAAKSSRGQSAKKEKIAVPKIVRRTYQDPASFIANRAQKVLSDLKSRPVRPVGSGLTISLASEASKSSWVTAIYSKHLVESSWATRMLSDKRIFAEVLSRELGDQAQLFYPKTMGLREFLVKKQLIQPNGDVTTDGDRIEDALYEEFPSGFVARPAVGVAPQETGRGMFSETDSFVMELVRPGTRMYEARHLRQPVKSHILDAIASGEALVLQENIIFAADAVKPLKNRYFQEVRVHTYEGRVVAGAVPTRWVQTNLLSEDDIKKAESFAADFLKSLPSNLLTRQAWGLDVAVMDNGQMRIVDVVTNRGQRIGWSSYLEQPRVIGAYARHLEAYANLKFEGVSGALIRNNFANYLPYWERRIEKARPGWNKILAYVPPAP